MCAADIVLLSKVITIFRVEPLTPQDRLRMGEIMTRYMDAEFDFVDLAIMAISIVTVWLLFSARVLLNLLPETL